MFIPAIKGQGTEEQQAKWLPLAETLQIVGTYAQVGETLSTGVVVDNGCC
jgi:hypothetical protein